MSDANRTAVGLVEEAVLGTTPATPAFEGLRVTGASLAYTKSTTSSKELRADRQVPDLITTGFDAAGDLPQEASYGALDSLLRGALQSDWNYSPVRDNNLSASTISAVSATAITVAAAAAGNYGRQGVFAQYMLVRATGFTNAGNNRQIVAGAASSGTSIVMTAGTVEASPPATARVKAVGFQAPSGDLVAIAGGTNGVTTTTLDFTTMGLAVGQWLWVGGLNAANAFATAGTKGWCRISAIAAHQLTFDVVPSTWAADAGAGKLVNVFTGDYVRNGVTRRSYTVELQYVDLAVPEYEYYSGMVVSAMELTVGAQQILTTKTSFMGMAAVNQTTRFTGATDVAAPTNDVFNTSSNVGTFLDNGAPLSGGNFVLSTSITINNNVRRNDVVASLSSINMGLGQVTVMGTLQMYYGSNAVLQKVRNSTASSYFLPLTDNVSKALLLDLPRIKYSDGNPTVPGINTDRVLDTKFQAVRHPTLGYTMHVQRFEEYNT